MLSRNLSGGDHGEAAEPTGGCAARQAGAFRLRAHGPRADRRVVLAGGHPARPVRLQSLSAITERVRRRPSPPPVSGRPSIRSTIRDTAPPPASRPLPAP